MSEWRTFICKSGKSNKFWEFRHGDGHSVEKRWGRIGGHRSTQTKEFSDSYSAIHYVDREIHRKLAKGYVESNHSELREEVEIAQSLGIRWKIDRMEFLGHPFDLDTDYQTIQLSDTYDPSCGVYVEILESWSSDRAYLLLNKRRAVQYAYGECVSRSGRLGGAVVQRIALDQNFEAGVRASIRKLAEIVRTVTVKFAAIGARAIDFDGASADASASPQWQSLVSQAAQSGVSAQVVSRFAAAGNRVLEI